MMIHRQLRDIGIVAAALFSAACSSSSQDAPVDSEELSHDATPSPPVYVYVHQEVPIYRYCLQGIPGPFQSYMGTTNMMDELVDKEKMTPAMKMMYESTQSQIQIAQRIRDGCSTQQSYETAVLIASFATVDLLHLYAIQQEMQTLNK